MLQSMMRMAGLDLSQQIAALRAQAEDFKDRTIDDVKGRVVDTALMIGLAAAGGVFLLITFGIGLIALYRVVGIAYGPFWGLGAVALLTTLLAAILFFVALSRGRRREKERAALAQARERLAALQAAAEAARSQAAAAAAQSAGAHAAAFGADPYAAAAAAGADLSSRAAAATSEAFATASELVRKSPKEAVFATLAVAALTGILIGRTR